MRGSSAVRACLGLVVVLLLLLVAVQNGLARDISAELPPGFQLRTITNQLQLPTDLAFLPDNRILVTQLGEGSGVDATADLVLVENGTVRTAPVLSLSVIREQDSGLLAIALDPDFETNGWFYLWYSPGISAADWDGNQHVRLSRFTWDPATAIADPQSELILLKSAAWEKWHHGNRLMFDATGNLWIAAGEMTRHEPYSQDLSRIEGKILRIRPNSTGYTIPTDNPFVNTPDARPEIYAYGLRNPYVMTQRQSDGLIAVGDVGAEKYEEINLLGPGLNYGWPVREGICPRGLYPPCDPASLAYTEPIVFWRHDLPPVESNGAITGLAFYEDEQFPEAYDGQLFYTDFSRKFLRVADPATGQTEPFGSDLPAITRLRVQDGLLYMLSSTENTLNIIYHEAGSNIAPSVTLSADADTGTPPHRVLFSAEGSDPDDTLLVYRWDFGDGSPLIESTENTAVHIYAEDGQYTASVVASDPRGAESLPAELPITVYSGEWPRLFVSNQTDATRSRYHGGDQMQYRVERSTLADLDAEAPFTWRILLHHGGHTHTYLSSNNAIIDTFTIPTENHDGATDIWYAFHVTMHTVSGLDIELSKQIEPALTSLTFTTTPGRHGLLVNGVQSQSPYTIDAIVGIENQVIALPDMYVRPNFYQPDRWTNGSLPLIEGDTLTLYAPAQDTSYQARYVVDRLGPRLFLPLVMR